MSNEIATTITNWYLYGQATRPANLVDENLIRPAGITVSCTYDATTYMTTGGGGFATGYQFDLIKWFLDPAPFGYQRPAIPVGEYSAAALAAQLGLQNSALVIRQRNFDDGAGDWRRRIRRLFSTPILVIFLGVFLIISEQAYACRSPRSVSTIFFDEVPAGIVASVIAHITITEIVGAPTYTTDGVAFSYVGRARVGQVIKGVIASETIEIVSSNTDCDIPFRVGSAGIVVGNLDHDRDGNLRLKASSRYVSPGRKNEVRDQDP